LTVDRSTFTFESIDVTNQMSPYLHFLLVSLLLPFTLPAEVSHITSKAFIEAINDKKSTWTARSNFQKNITDDLLSGIIQTKETFYTDDENGVLNYQTQYFPNISENFDARQEWPECEKIISFIRNQGLCSTSWVMRKNQSEANFIWSLGSRPCFCDE
jgi:hypothetical protein